MRTQIMRFESNLTLGEAALRGAAAGLAGGMAVLALSWLVQRGVLSTDDTVDAQWERLVKKAAQGAGLELSKGQARIARVTAQLTYSVLVGAAYGIARSRRSLPGALRAALNSGLVHAASVPMVAQTVNGRQPKRRGRRGKRGVAVPLGSAALYGLTTSAAFSALERA